jgi:hypothetical protein
MTTNRSSEELAMRAAVAEWGRARWPDARVIHELVTGQCRIDMAFVRPADLIGVEIKSSRDVLDRLDKQMAEFHRTIPVLWLAYAPKWSDHVRSHYSAATANRLQVDVSPETGPKVGDAWEIHHKGVRNWRVYSGMLELLWADETRAVATRKRVSHAKRAPQYTLMPELARLLTGQEIIEEVCRELRGRAAFAAGSDAPVAVAA